MEITSQLVPSIGRWLVLLYIVPGRYLSKASSCLGSPWDGTICQRGSSSSASCAPYTRFPHAALSSLTEGLHPWEPGSLSTWCSEYYPYAGVPIMITPGMDEANRPNHMLLCSVGGRLWVALLWPGLCCHLLEESEMSILPYTAPGGYKNVTFYLSHL